MKVDNRQKKKKKPLLPRLLGLFGVIFLTLAGIGWLTEQGEPMPGISTGAVAAGQYNPILLEEKAPVWDGKATVVVGDNQPSFSRSERELTEAFEYYSPLDEDGRCGIAFANLGRELMPTGERGDISQVYPSGWKKNMGWERCHLIAFMLAGENDNAQNLVTGTHYFNTSAMLPWENQVAYYIRSTGNHVLYRVTPVYDGDALIPSGAEMEGWSVEDSGAGVCFHVFAFNVQPDKVIDYYTGTVTGSSGSDTQTAVVETVIPSEVQPQDTVYISKRGKIHTNPHCSGMTGAAEMTWEAAAAAGYEPCPMCGPGEKEPVIKFPTQPEDIVYISKRGKIHTKSSCSGMTNAAEMTLAEAEEQGYEICPKCGPNQEVQP